MHLQNHRREFADGLAVISEGGFVGCADLAQPGAAGFEDFRDAKSAADLD